MKINKLLLLTFLVSLFSFSFFAQEADITEDLPVVISETVEEEKKEPAVEKNDESVKEDTEKEEPVVDESVKEEPAEEKKENSVVEKKEETVKEEPEKEKPVVEKKEESEKETPVVNEPKKENSESKFVPIRDDETEISKTEEKEEKQRPQWLEEILNSDIPFFNRLDFVFGFTPTIYVNAQGDKLGAPSPIVYPIYFGFHWPNDTFISLQPSFKFFRSYYLVNDDLVLPAEMEHRIVDAWSCILNIPVVFRLNFWDKVNFKAFAGLAFLIRIPTLAAGVAPDDWGYYGSAEEDYNYIKKWLVNSWRFLYISGGVDFMFNISDTLQIGPEFSIYLPLGAVLSDWSLDALMASVGFKVAF